MAQTVGNFTLDPLVVAQLPLGSRILDASVHGSSTWSQTARIVVQLIDGNRKQLFLKCASKHSKPMIEGEYMSLLDLHKLDPSFVAKPL
ncbi:hypothetical protein VE04_03329 [Pseudogymnoascus sp. 24MN13]|nr:hypothetical protein VE04_03329 [Pseudogymnoascus sp. 24MN13]